MFAEALSDLSVHWRANYDLVTSGLEQIALQPYDPEVRKSAKLIPSEVFFSNESAARCSLIVGEEAKRIVISNGLYIRLRILVCYVRVRLTANRKYPKEVLSNLEPWFNALRKRAVDIASKNFDSLEELLSEVSSINKDMDLVEFEDFFWSGEDIKSPIYRATLGAFEFLVFHEICHLYDGHWLAKNNLEILTEAAGVKEDYSSIRGAFEYIADSWGSAAMANRFYNRIIDYEKSKPERSLNDFAFDSGFSAAIGINSALICLNPIASSDISSVKNLYPPHGARMVYCGYGLIIQFVHDMGEDVAEFAARGWFEGQTVFEDLLELGVGKDGNLTSVEFLPEHTLDLSKAFKAEDDDVGTRIRLLWSLDKEKVMRERGYMEPIQEEERNYDTFSARNKEIANRIISKVLGASDDRLPVGDDNRPG